METLDERVARMEGILSQMSERLNHLETRLEEGLKELRSGQWRIVWLLIGMWVTVIVTVLLKG